MTDKERLAKLNKAIASLKRTTRGYTPNGVHWRIAMKELEALQADLKAKPKPPASKVPNLGPIVRDGKSVLLHDLTHATSGMPPGGSKFPAFDDAFGDTYRDIVAPEDGEVYKQSSSKGGDAFYFRGVSKIEYWIGHAMNVPATGKKFRKGERMADVAPISKDDGGPHVHLGINAIPLIGKDLVHHTNYTHGAPTVGAQLTAALNK